MSVVWWILLGLVLGLIGMVPVTRVLLRRGEQRVRDAEKRARRSERLAELGSMTGGLAHEIKNPLSTIGLNAQLLAESIGEADLPDDERSRLTHRLDALQREVERLRGILTDFLQFAGRMKLDPQPVELGQLVEELSDFFHPQCEQAGVVLRTQIPPAPVTVRVDEGLLKQALLNTMINAVHAMGDGGELMLHVASGDGEARVHVIDTGPGIEPEKLETIFHPYVSHKSGGTGLGLPTARRIIEEHGGRLEAVSELNQGSDFVFHLPLDA